MKEEKTVTTKKSTSTKTPKKTGSTEKKATSTSKSTKGSSTVKKTSTSKKTTTAKKSTSTVKDPKKSTTTKSTKVTTTKKNPPTKEVKTETKKFSTPKKTSGAKKTTTVKKESAKSSVKKEEAKKIVPKTLETTIFSEEVIDETKDIHLEEQKEENTSSAVKEEKNFFESNFILIIIVVAWIFIFAMIGIKLYQKHQEKLYHAGYFYQEKVDVKTIDLKNLTDVVFNHSEGDMFVLFTYRGMKDTYQLEKELNEIIKDYDLLDRFYYIDMTDYEITNDCDYKCLINTELSLSSVKNVPAIAYFSKGELVDIAQREDKKVLEAADFVKLLDIYEFQK